MILFSRKVVLALFLTFLLEMMGSSLGQAQTCVDPPSGLVSWWKLDGDYTDSAGSNDGSPVISQGLSFVTDPYSKVGTGALNFDNSQGAEVSIPASTNLEPANSRLTLEGWIKGNGSSGYILSKSFDACGASSYALVASPSFGIYFYVRPTPSTRINNQLTQSSGFPGSGIWNNQYHHIAGTYDGQNVCLYVDGGAAGAGGVAGSSGTYCQAAANLTIDYQRIPSANNGALILGRYGTSQCPLPWNGGGTIDEFTFYNTALSAENIRNIYDASTSGKCTGGTSGFGGTSGTGGSGGTSGTGGSAGSGGSSGVSGSSGSGGSGGTGGTSGSGGSAGSAGSAGSSGVGGSGGIAGTGGSGGSGGTGGSAGGGGGVAGTGGTSGNGGSAGSGGAPVVAACGNRILDVGEECEDGNTTSGDGCSNTCQKELIPTCGNRLLETAEECEDGNTINGDGCSSLCKKENVQSALCGNRILEMGEECEDGNTTNGDGCSSVCRKELPPATFSICGNRILETSEECEDGNIVSEDGCSSACKKEASGELAGGIGEVNGGSDDSSPILGGQGSCSLILP